MRNPARYIIAALALSALATAPISAQAYDLVGDWQDNHNPNGPWSYREGTTILPWNPSWTAGVSFPVVQPAYQPGNVPGDFLPAWYKATSSPVNFDNQIGDVIVHTNDQFNGNPALGVANVLFTNPIAGQYHIFGNLWDASHFFSNRPQDWVLLVDGVNEASGVLSGFVTRSSPETFDLPTLTLNGGDTVELEVFEDPAAAAGFFVGTNLTINQIGAVPAPLIGCGLPALLAVGGMLFCAKLLEGSKRRRSLATGPRA